MTAWVQTPAGTVCLSIPSNQTLLRTHVPWTKVSENPNVVAMKERSSETWGTVVEKTKAGVEKVKEASAPVTSKVGIELRSTFLMK